MTAPHSLNEVAERLTADLLPPFGYQIKVDRRTNNILVQNELHGFVISSVCVGQWPYERIVAHAKTALHDLGAGAEHSTAARFYSVEQLFEQGSTSKTAFY